MLHLRKGTKKNWQRMANTLKYSLKKGTIINNRYEIVRYISSGGFGITYEAFDRGFKARVAIKELYIKEICYREANSITVSINETNEQTFVTHRRKFIEEARRLHDLSHPNIVKVSDVVETNGTAYFVMEYIDGKPLSRVDIPLSERMARWYINPILDALEYVHNKGLLHLDIKPGNIMIDRSGNAILIDFGTSKVYGDTDGNSLSLSTSLAYTPGYAPLEQMSVKTVKDLGTYSDIYAIGTTLYYILTGEKPLLPGEILENGGKLPLVETLSKEMQCAITQATKLVRATRLETVDQFRRALKGEIIDVEAEGRRRKEEKRRKEEERRRKEEEEKRRKEEELRKTVIVSADTVVPKDKNDKTQPADNDDKTVDDKTIDKKEQKSNKKTIFSFCVALIVNVFSFSKTWIIEFFSRIKRLIMTRKKNLPSSSQLTTSKSKTKKKSSSAHLSVKPIKKRNSILPTPQATQQMGWKFGLLSQSKFTKSKGQNKKSVQRQNNYQHQKRPQNRL